MTDIPELPQAAAVKKLTREQISDLRNSFEVWQQDYDPVHDKEQHDMFALGVVAMNEMLAAMDGEADERRIAELEARTVKLPKPLSVLHRRDFIDAHRAIYAYSEAEVNAALDNADIKWEAK